MTVLPDTPQHDKGSWITPILTRIRRHGLALYILRRIGLAIITVFGVSILVFLVTRIMVSDPARVIAGPQAPPSKVHEVAQQLGINEPLVNQYVTFITQALHGDFGVSAVDGTPVLNEVLGHAGATLELAVVGTVLGAGSGLLFGALAARRPRGVFDRIVAVTAAIGVAMPVYWLGLLMILAFAVHMHLLPAAGNQRWDSITLPALSIAIYVYAIVSRISRSSISETLSKDYIRTAVAKGCSSRQILWQHALPNAAIPIVTIVGVQFGYLLGGAILTETVFAWPGIGNLLVTSIFSSDLPVIMGAIIFFAILFVLVNLLVDLAYLVLDPRVEY